MSDVKKDSVGSATMESEKVDSKSSQEVVSPRALSHTPSEGSHSSKNSKEKDKKNRKCIIL